MTGAPRHCIKCGREVGPDETMCEICNRAGMATPSASQYHGTMVVAIVLGVILLAMAGSLALRGVGPYSAQVVAVAPGAADAAITIAVTNQGTKAGRAKCQLVANDSQGRSLQSLSVVSPIVPGGQRITFDERMPGLAAQPQSVSVACQ
jgi:hypothetical protein